MSKNERMQEVVEEFRKKEANDLPEGLVAAIIETQANLADDPKACEGAISDLLTEHLESKMDE